MQILTRSILRVGRVDFDPPRFCRWWSLLDRLSRLDNFFGRSTYKPWSLVPFTRYKTKCNDIENIENKRTKAIMKLMEYRPLPASDDDDYVVNFKPALKNSSHRDGAIYKKDNCPVKGCLFVGDVADRNETRLEPMMFSKVTRCCTDYFPEDMVQFFSVRLIKSPICNGSTQVYGYIAARDERDGMLNYIVNYSRDDPIVVQQGSLIEMTGPKRGILLDSIVLIEFDMRIKSGRHEEDLQLIDGAMPCSWYTHTRSPNTPSPPIIDRITGDSGIVDICLATIMSAAAATIEVVILQVLSGSNLSIGSFLDILDDYEEIQLFHGKVDQSEALRRFVVAVPLDSIMFLKFEVGNNVQCSQHGCATKWVEFEARQHGCASRRIKLKLATILVKVSWSPI